MQNCYFFLSSDANNASSFHSLLNFHANINFLHCFCISRMASRGHVKLEPRLNSLHRDMGEDEPLQLTTHPKHGSQPQHSPPMGGNGRPASSSPYHQIPTTTTQMLSPHHMLPPNRVLSPPHSMPSSHSLSPSHYALAAVAAAQMQQQQQQQQQHHAQHEMPPMNEAPPTNGQIGTHEEEEELEQAMNHH